MAQHNGDCGACGAARAMRAFSDTAFDISVKDGNATRTVSVDGLSGWQCAECNEVIFDAESAGRYCDGARKTA